MGLLEDMVRLELRIQRMTRLGSGDDANDAGDGDVRERIAQANAALKELAAMNERLKLMPPSVALAAPAAANTAGVATSGKSAAAVAGALGLDTADAEAVHERNVRIHADEYNRLRVELRKVSLRARSLAAANHAKERAALLQGAPAPGSSGADDDGAAGGTGVKQRNTAAAALSKARDVTSTLRRTRQLMANEMSRVANVSDMLAGDHKTMGDTLNEHKLYSGDVRQSGAHLSKLKRRNLTDKIVIGFGVVLFACVVIYILWRRLRYIVGFFGV